jgi:putative spermidine/putrescine transport system permease protein
MRYLKPSLSGRIALSVAGTLILLFLGVPILVILLTSFGSDSFGGFPPHEFSTKWYTAIFASGSPWKESAALSALIAIAATAVSIALAVFAATGLAKRELPLKSAVYALVLAPLLVPQIVTALGLFLLFEPFGLVGSPVAIAAGHVVITVPIAVLILVATLRGIDDRLEDAAASLGASRLVTLRRIVLPLALPGVMAAAVFSFITSFDEFFIAQFMASPETVTLPIRIFNALQYTIDPTVTAVSALLIALTTLTLMLVLLTQRIASGQQGASGLLAMAPATIDAGHGGESSTAQEAS